ncbi:3-dehydroquinate synthase [Parvularcula sp. LCG005]|uniref:3-dehydroquinate synthase n=1 Tax=Parvularcula sp. LCG005 TaxID=3078805 RepID=UPI002942A574|nr:3-dehydroquinate synthase [Parvularcula sp. LCG005]WOI52489.1 3-dehydroquinate synthase [Parvularcula sp. LCG005]
MTLTTVPVSLGTRSYDIHIGRDALWGCADALRHVIGRGQAAIVADETVWAAHGQRLIDVVGDVPLITVPPGEASKNFEQYARVSEALLKAGVGRDGTVIAFGGGVVGDLAGFCASTLRRGSQFVQIPTTLLAQVDSSVGGKTAINAKAGKNLIGAFHQPALVITDLAFLDTLPERQMRAGYAEVVKYGLLGDADFYSWLDQNKDAVLARDDAALTHAIKISCEMKAEIVAEDETEKGRRALLNLGHTFGHALEAVCGYSDRLLHGEGVAAGMAMAYRYSAAHGLCATQHAQAVTQHLRATGLPAGPLDIEGLSTDANEQLALMYQDKKVEGGALTLILARDIGDAFVAKNIDPAPLRDFLAQELQS